MKLHTAILRDRFVLRGQNMLKASAGRNGPSFDVVVNAADYAAAASLYGGAVIRYSNRGKSKHFVAN